MTETPIPTTQAATAAGTIRYFLTYRGVHLPLQLSEELQAADLRHRNTWFEARHDAAGRVVNITQQVYGEVVMQHHYHYDAQGRLCQAIVSAEADEPARVMHFPA